MPRPCAGLHEKPRRGCHICRQWARHPDVYGDTPADVGRAQWETGPPAQAPVPAGPAAALRWACGVTAVPQRRYDLLPRTLASLAAAGFPPPRLFVDGTDDGPGWAASFGLEVTARWPRVNAVNSWVLALWELYARDPRADRYALFQDDLVCVRNLRAYLEACPYPERAYLNLYTFASNQSIAPLGPGGKQRPGWYESNQLGRGAVALVFSREAAVTLLASRNTVDKPASVRGHKSLDGMVVTSMQLAGWREYVHSPSLTQHTGEASTMGNMPHQPAPSFPGEGFDALELLCEGGPVANAGPGIQLGKVRLGDRVEGALSAVGITSERVSAWLGRPCNCKERRDKLNRLSAAAERWLGGLFGSREEAQAHVEGMLGEPGPEPKEVKRP